MSKHPFHRIRALDDKVLVGALSNHGHALLGVTSWIRSHERWQWVWRVWALALTLAVFWLAHGDDVQRWWATFTL